MFEPGVKSLGLRPITLLLAVVLQCFPGLSLADELRVAVASNFMGAMSEIADRFEAEAGHNVTLSPGSTGKHYAQIINGAPFDLFFAADALRPRLLETGGQAMAGTRFTYALGRLALWSPKAGLVDQEGKVLGSDEYRFLAIANPKLAPYGKAAREVLEALGLWDALAKRLVRGENIGQAFQFVHSGNAELGFVAWSQLKQSGDGVKGSLWDVPQDMYSAIEQQAVLLNDTEVARAFLDFMRSEEALQIIAEYGYLNPESSVQYEG